jgi:glyoxylase-like metal-dependent hydrolase (beta-lactamase superfamily II)
LGGLGSLGAVTLGSSAISEVIAEIGSLTSKPFAINLWVSTSDREASHLGLGVIEERICALAHYYAELGIEPPSKVERQASGFRNTGPGPDGKVVVDTFLLPAWPKLKETLDGLGNAPLKTVIDTHLYFDHTDNNANLHAADATVLAHENTKTRMAEPRDSVLLGLHIPASPADALPQQTFSSSQKLQANGEIVMLQYFQPAHTDTDIYIHFQKANVIHMGDTFFNGFYPVIDASTGGKIDGMIVAADKVLPLADNNTKIVPGHGPLGNKADLTKSRDMLVVARDRVQKLKTAGKSADEIAASRPLADLDPVWGGMLGSDVFVRMIYSSL